MTNNCISKCNKEKKEIPKEKEAEPKHNPFMTMENELKQKLIAEFLVKMKRTAEHFYVFGREGYEDFDNEWKKWDKSCLKKI